MTPAEIEQVHPQVPQWTVEQDSGIDHLRRVFPFKDFQAALEFADRVGALAEEQGHHPVLTIEWGKATVQWWTHKIKGLHRNDFIMAAQTDDLYQRDI
jgi:4a-hydroxytetrahydrobiopterin dehydratase